MRADVLLRVLVVPLKFSFSAIISTFGPGSTCRTISLVPTFALRFIRDVLHFGYSLLPREPYRTSILLFVAFFEISWCWN